MQQPSIPVVDLRDFHTLDIGKRQAFILTVGDALRDIGFFALVHHGIDADLIQKAYTVQSRFFDLPTASKTRYEVAELGGQRGYTGFGKEHAKDHHAPDLKEFWHIGQPFSEAEAKDKGYAVNLWPTELPEFKTVMMDLYHRLEICALQLLEACSLYLGEPAARLRDIAVKGDSILRLINYPPIPADVHPLSVRAAAHEDINLITLLIEATASGLEIKDRNGQWLPVVTPPGCIIVDAGDMLQNLTNGYLKSTTHRVANPDNSRERRLSMPFFMHARREVPLDPMPACVRRTGGTELFPKITAGDYLMQRLREIGLIK